MATSSTKYSWVADLKTGTFLANSRELVRVMGVVVALREFSPVDRVALSPLVTNGTRIESKDNNTHNGSLEKQSSPAHGTGTAVDAFVSVTIDDGTDSIALCTPRTIMQSPSAPKVGKTYDCILKLKQNREKKTWFADTLIEIDDPMDEHFRWLELGHHGQSSSKSQSSRLRYSNLCHKFGFPMRKRNSLEAYRLICVNSKMQQEQQQQPPPPPATQRRKTTIPTRSRNIPMKRNPSKWISRPSLSSRPRGLQNSSTANRSNIIKTRQENFKRRLSQPQAQTTTQGQPQTKPQAKPKPLEGLLLKDLATVLQKSELEVQDMIEGLQLEGKIYQNEKGEYLPL